MIEPLLGPRHLEWLERIITDEAHDFLVDEGPVIHHPDACARRIAERVVERIERDKAAR